MFIELKFDLNLKIFDVIIIIFKLNLMLLCVLFNVVGWFWCYRVNIWYYLVNIWCYLVKIINYGVNSFYIVGYWYNDFFCNDNEILIVMWKEIWMFGEYIYFIW